MEEVVCESRFRSYADRPEFLPGDAHGHMQRERCRSRYFVAGQVQARGKVQAQGEVRTKAKRGRAKAQTTVDEEAERPTIGEEDSLRAPEAVQGEAVWQRQQRF